MANTPHRPMPDFSEPEAQPFFFQGGKIGVLFIHGFTATIAQWRPIADIFHQAGYTVRGINLPGHATTVEDMGKTTYKDWLAAAEQALDEMNAICDQVVVAGLSMGGDIALILASRGKAAACIPTSAPTGVKNTMLPFTGLISLFVPTIWWRDNPERAARVDKRYSHGYPGFPARKGMDMRKMLILANRALPNVTCPLLVIQSHGDETIQENSADTILAGAASAVKEVMWLTDAPHVCTITKDRDAIAQRMLTFVRTHVGEPNP